MKSVRKMANFGIFHHPENKLAILRILNPIPEQGGCSESLQACGILPAPPETEKPAVADREAVARIRLLKSVNSVQARLRRFSEKNITLDKRTRKELLNAKAEIDRLFDSLVG